MEDRIIAVTELKEAMALLCSINDGDCALLYAYIAACGGSARMSDAQLHTGFDDRRMERAESLLLLYKLCRRSGEAPVRPDDGYTPAELLAAKKTDPAFAGICDYLEQALGRSIRKSEIEILYGIYDKLNMPPDVILLLINYCRIRNRLSARELERRAYQWHDEGIMSYSAAADMVQQAEDSRGRYGALMSLLGLGGRSPSESEEKYLAAWCAEGFSNELIKLAYDRTMLRTGRLQWRYMHSILSDWKKKGCTTRADVERSEGVTGPSPTVKKQSAKAEESVEESVTKAFEKRLQEREALKERRLQELRRKSPDFARNEVELGSMTVARARAALKGDRAEVQRISQRQKELSEERAYILKGLGVDESYISIPPDCPDCGDRGYIGDHMCHCFKKACMEEERRRASAK